MALTAYFDESGTNPGDPALCFAGFISDDQRWSAFSDRWNAAMTEWDIEYFHMTDFEARREQFSDWPRDDESARRLEYLLSLIREHVLAVVTVVFTRELFEDYYRLTDRTEERLYLSITGFSMMAAHRLLEGRLGGGQLALVYERGARGRDYVDRGFRRFRRSFAAFGLGPLAFAGKKDSPPLQAADILAYEIFRHYPRASGDEDRPARYPLRRLLDGSLPGGGGVITRQNLDDVWSHG